MRWAALACALLGACGDGGVANGDKAADAIFTVTLESEDVEEGARPRLTLSCGEVGRSLMLHLVRRPDPPPEGGAAGLFKVDAEPPKRVRIERVRDDIWAPIMDEPARRALIARIAAARSVYFTGPLGTTDHVYRWDLARMGGNLERLRAACA